MISHSLGKSRVQTALDDQRRKVYAGDMIVTAEVGARQLADLIKQVQAGNEILLTQDNKPVAKIISASENGIASPGAALNVRSIKGHRVLTPTISQAELAEEMFGQQ